MNESSIPLEIQDFLSDVRYVRSNPLEAHVALRELGVPEDSSVYEFYGRYAGSFWSEYLGIELLDVVEGKDSIKISTAIARDVFGFPEKYLVITQYAVGQVTVIDVEVDLVYEVNMQEGMVALLVDELAPQWAGFIDFLKEYFLGEDLRLK